MKRLLIFITSLLSANASSQTEFDLDKILKSDRKDMIVIEIDNYLNQKCEYGEKIEKLNSSQQTFLFIKNLEREINNGGFNQFYFNSSGDYSQETVNALFEIGANKTAEIVKKANSEFENGTIPKNSIERRNKLELIKEKSEENWNKCDSQFYEFQDNLAELLIVFVTKNKQDFIK